jgi:UDP-N-acetylglucosamine--N-acetylmuramyl-(pentapeptide) pyrophosphoryl-undecaprenol N-acetylglucosamine transferase
MELRERGFRLRWVGTRRGLESRVVPEADIALHCLPMRGLRGKGVLQQLSALVLMGMSVLASLWLMLRFRPALVIGMGGYASFPAAVAAWLTRRPLVLQEQNAVAGSANRALARFAGVIATGFPGVLTGYATARYLGNPVRRDLLPVAAASPWNWIGDRPLRVLVLGGSLGARPLNEALPRVAAALGARCEWRHQCGPAHATSTRDAYAAAVGTDWQVDPYVEDMAGAYAWADLVVCRAGALTVAELAVTGRPSLLVPLPYAIDDHQTANARFLADAGAGLLLPQEVLNTQLESTLSDLLAEPSRLAVMAARTLELGRPDATRAIADCALGLMR